MDNNDIFDDLDNVNIIFDHVITGTEGTFWSAGGEVDYILTSAKLSLNETEMSAKLTRQLYPVREVLEFDKMDFDQLLQRDLDDHRVATQLIPYLLENSHKGLSFFPPIVAALLPFNNKTPKEKFDDEVELDIEVADGASWLGVQSGSAYKYQYLVSKSGKKTAFNLSRLSWNEGGARLVVLDGQHRAMAMLAIARTITDSWGDSTGEKYRYFYEDRIKDVIQELGSDWLEENVEKIEFPVCVIRFNSSGNETDQHDSARKLFVDVNQTARKPSESRIILLSDNDLMNIFTRKILNLIRKYKSSFTINAVEYDYPGSSKKVNSTKPIKWSAILNIEMLREVVLRTTFGPYKYIDDVDQTITGKPNEKDQNQFMRETLGLDKWFPKEYEYEGNTFLRDNIGAEDFPKDKLDDFISNFENSWGRAIVKVLENLKPFQVHSDSLKELIANWAAIDADVKVAKAAISEGQGMYWTLKSHYKHWKENKGSKDDMALAWEAINKKSKEFDTILSERYLGSKKKSDVQDVKKFFEYFNTYASVVGLFMTLSSLVRAHNITGTSIPGFVSSVISILNKSLSKDRKKSLFLSKELNHPLIRIKGMEPADAVYFRYFWLELLNSSKEDFEANGLDESKVTQFIDKSRSLYLDKVIKTEYSFLRSNYSSSELKSKQHDLLEQATNKAEELISKSLKYIFDYEYHEIMDWCKSKRGSEV